MPVVARVTKGLADALRLAPFHLAGVSMGGVIAREYAAAWPGDLLSVALASAYAKPDPLTSAASETWALIAEAAAAVSSRARRFAPSRRGTAFERHSAAWFDPVRASAAVHNPQELT